MLTSPSDKKKKPARQSQQASMYRIHYAYLDTTFPVSRKTTEGFFGSLVSTVTVFP